MVFAKPSHSPPALLAVLLVGLLAACQTVPLTKKYPAITWTDLEPYRLAVARIEIVKEYQPPMTEPNVDHLMPIPPIRAMEEWAAERLVAGGEGGVARVIIRDAGAIDEPLPTKDMFTKEQSDRFRMSLEMLIEIYNDRGFKAGFVIAKATRARTLPEGSSLAEREDLWYEMTKAAMGDLNKELDRNIRKYFAAFLM